MNNISKHLKLATYYAKQLLCWPVYCVSSLTPKNSDLWIFSSWHGKKYSDNPRYLFEYVLQNKKNIKAYWITKNYHEFELIKKSDVPCLYAYSPKGLYTQLRAGIAVFSHSQFTEFFPSIVSKKTKRIQLWHGTPLKKIGKDVVGTFDNSNLLLSKLRKTLFPWFMEENYDFVISSSPEVSGKMSRAFLSKEVVVTGYPRNDKFTKNSIQNWNQNIHKIIYMPTYRDGKRGNNSDDNTNNIIINTLLREKDSIEEWFINNKAQLILKLHPSNTPTEELNDQISQIPWLNLYDDKVDIYEYLDEIDILITDYSSIMFDFLLAGKPIINAPFDLEQYLLNSRELYYEYTEVAITRGFKSWEGIVNFLDTIKNDGLSINYINKYNKVCHKFNAYNDSSSSHRVYNEIANLLDKQTTL